MPEDWRQLQTRIEAQRGMSSFPPTEWGVGEIPAERYLAEEWLAVEREKVFRGPCWLLAGRTERIPEAGDYFVADVGTGGTIIVSRNREGRVRAFLNSCRHRGTELVAEAGNARHFRCPYHAWLYTLDGELVSVPDEEQFYGLDKKQRGLVPVRVESWAGFVWVTLDPNASPLEDYVADLLPQFAPYRLEEMVTVHQQTWEFPVNWKVIVDAFNEIYHVPGIHPQTVEPFLDVPAGVMDGFGWHTRMVLPFKFPDSVMRSPDMPELPVPAAAGLDPVQRNSDFHFTVFPNVQFNLLPNYATLFVAVPIDARRTRFTYAFFGYRPKDGEQREYYERLNFAFLVPMNEDFANFPKVQRGIESRANRGFLLNYQEKR
ncbi:MAG: aromatic ring-hydroxylating oxygenase subunit alpha, partial [Candidatus Binatia bacterium]